MLTPSTTTKALKIGTRPEVELLLRSIRTHINAEDAQLLKILLQENLDWIYLLQTAASHGVMPLLYWNLSATCPEAFPKAILNQLRDYFHANALRNVYLTQELPKILSLLKANEILAIPFKGPVLAALAYNNLALRQFSDLDILVHKRDFLKAKELLIGQGYQHICSFQSIYSTEQEVAHFQPCHLSGEGGRVGVDLHYEITSKDFFLLLDVEMMWERLKTVSLFGITVLTFSPEDLLLILCLNGTKEYWRSLERICDIAALIHAHQELDWEYLMEQASRQSNEVTLFTGLFLANTLLGTALPDSVWQTIQATPGFSSPVWQVREWLFNEIHRPREVINFYLFNMQLIKRLQDKMRYFLYLISPNLSDILMLPLPPLLRFFYYPIRLLRITGKYLINPAYTNLLQFFKMLKKQVLIN
ncbi:nucleotidyltransferase family protein [Floridanema aerugineum]|uniref:Nucleotidyltransferase family protein n=1 Tax=Floridaenema aerugineum BLCC-F46 TaxID=3153654 RepID=A0ABV4XCW9_9CYAN